MMATPATLTLSARWERARIDRDGDETGLLIRITTISRLAVAPQPDEARADYARAMSFARKDVSTRASSASTSPSPDRVDSAANACRQPTYGEAAQISPWSSAAEAPCSNFLLPVVRAVDIPDIGSVLCAQVRRYQNIGSRSRSECGSLQLLEGWAPPRMDGEVGHGDVVRASARSCPSAACRAARAWPGRRPCCAGRAGRRLGPAPAPARSAGPG